MQSKAKTVNEYLAGLPSDRREAIQAIRAVVLKNLPKGSEEGMQYGMVGYFVPHSVSRLGIIAIPSTRPGSVRRGRRPARGWGYGQVMRAA